MRKDMRKKRYVQGNSIQSVIKTTFQNDNENIKIEEKSFLVTELKKIKFYIQSKKEKLRKIR